MQNYFRELEDKVKVCYSIAEQAREKGLDPLSKVEVPLATSLAERVTGLISTLYPQLSDPRIVKRILELEKEFGALNPAVALQISEEIAREKFCKFTSLLEAIDSGIRVGMAYMTLGVVSSPIEGFTYLNLKKTRDSEDYFSAYFSGPIRSAGGTAAAFSLIIIDYLREIFNFARYDPTEQEIKRAITELYDYHEKITNLQYLPTEEEIEFLARNLPIQVNGEPSEDKEVSNYKDLERIETNIIRSGFCLVLGEGIAQKAAKIWKMVKSLREKGFKLNCWDFLQEYMKIHEKREKGEKKDSPTYIQDLVAGRPVLGHPSKNGAFRLVYGRSRFSGYSALAIHPATMVVLDEFVAIGTQLKIELPTKGAAITVCDDVDGPIIKLDNGSVKKLKTMEEAKELKGKIEEIIYLGDILVPYGDFANRNHILMPAGYEEKQWLAEIREKNFLATKDFSEIIKLSEEGIPLHPDYIYYWSQVSYENFLDFLDWLSHSEIKEGKLIFPYNKLEQERFKKGKRALELLGVEHEVAIENVVLNEKDTGVLLLNLGIKEKNLAEEAERIFTQTKQQENVLDIVNLLCKYKIKDKAGTFIGSRMGRPEKAKLRKLVGSPNVLFPVGQEGGRLRSFLEACNIGSVKADFPIYYCNKCGQETIYYICEICGGETEKLHHCSECQQKFSMKKCPQHNIGQKFCSKRIDIKHFFDSAVKKLGFEKQDIPIMVKGVRGTSSEHHDMENLAKGILRAKFNLCVNKDGTIRYDATELPITHFKPKEIFVGVEKLKDFGYTKDKDGKRLENEEQILELKPHDILLPCCPETLDEKADDVFLRICKFIDSLLVKFYKLKPFYNASSRDDLLGHLVACIAPHNCACVAGRIIGFTKTQSLVASPYIHAACRRDCLGYNSYIPIGKNGNWKIVKIGEFVENLNPREKADNFGALKKKIEKIGIWGNPGKEKVTEVTKHTPRKLFKICLEDGRQLEVTENHKVYIKGKKEKRSYELKIGDKLMVSYKKNIEEKDVKEIFLQEIFRDRDNIMLRNINGYLSKFENLDKSENFYQRDSYPIKFVKEFLEKHNKTLKDLPSEIKIAIKRDKVSLPIRIPLDEKLLEVIGLYIAEGYSRKNDSKKGFYQVCISGNEEIKNLVKKIFYSHFNLKPTEDHFDHVTYSSRIVYELFKNYLKTGDRAKNKRIPNLFLNLKKEKIAALLRGYFEGDGSVSLSDIRVTCDTVSEGLKHDLSFVLSRFNIFTKFYEYEKEPGPQVRKFYLRKNRQIPKFKITKIIIPSNFVKKFREIGFISKRKNYILNKICEKFPYGMKIDFDENYVYPKIKRIEELGERESYCLNVSPEHNFFANDLLVRNCDGDEIAVMLMLDMLLNFSRHYLPAHRGGTQDAPLVLNARIRAGEVDDMVFDVDIVKEYPLALYEAGEKFEHPSKVKIEQIKNRIGGEEFTNLNYTHETSDINYGVLCSAYKKIVTMQEKVEREMQLVEKIRAVNATDVARLVIERHFIRDIKGNLRKFSQQEFRCVKCNSKFRRPPLAGKCTSCGGRIIFTISEGGIIKYLEPALSLAEKYEVPAYVKQNLELTKKYIESIFGKETEKQEALGKWF